MITVTKEQAVRIMVNVMCNRGFMNDWFGIVDKEFRDEQTEAICLLSLPQLREWIMNNGFNICFYCRVPKKVLFAALGGPVELPDYWFANPRKTSPRSNVSVGGAL